MSEETATPQAVPERKTFGRKRLTPGAYTLDLSAAADLPVMVNGEPSTFLAAYYKLSDSKIQEMPERASVREADKYITEAGLVVLACDWRLLSEMRTLLDLARQGMPPGEVTWFYYDFDWSQDADVSHDFFVVHRGEVVLEFCNFSSEDPRILNRKHDDNPIWHSRPYFDEAFERYWYRKFYSETVTGQLMVLRPDEPTLFHQDRPQTRDVVKDIERITLIKAYRLLWVVVSLLAAIAFPLIRELMGVVAVLLTIDVLYRCWATRKVGE